MTERNPDLCPIRPQIFDGCDGIVAAFSTRTGGVSAGPHASLNLGIGNGDGEENVRENRVRFLTELGFRVDCMALAGQVHGTRIARIDSPARLSGFDGMVTRELDIALCILAADCAAVLLADAHTRVLGACHAGWRGAAGGVVTATVDAMAGLQANPASIRAYVSPCISLGNFEVGYEVADQFDDSLVSINEESRRPHVDLRGHIRQELINCRIPDTSIQISDACTFGEPDRLFSYRRDGARSGRMMGMIGMSD